jgi:polyisoprenoid-binding protein YceI
MKGNEMIKKSLAVLLFLVVSTAAQTTPGTYPIDTNHSTVGFSVPILGGLSKVKGKFSEFTVTLIADDKDITKSTVNVVIKTASIDTGISARDNHLRTADFFDAEKYPEITFKSTRIDKKGSQLTLVGTLALHGVEKEVSMPFSVVGVNKDAAAKKMVIGYAGNLILNRRDFGINWTHKTNPDFVGDNIEIEINLITRALDLK